MAGQLAVRRYDPELLLTCEGALPVVIPATIELPRILVGPFLRDVVRSMGRTGTEVEVEGFVGIDLFRIGNELNCPVREVRGEVVTLLWSRRRLHLVVVVDEVGVPLAGIATEEAVEPLETSAQRPAVVGTGSGLLTCRDQVPFAHHVGVVALTEQNFGQKPVLKWNIAVVARKARRELGDTRHGVAVVVPSRDDARSAR